MTESADYSYFGGGATSPTYFGYNGVPADGHRELAFLVDASVVVQATRNLEIHLYYGHGFGQDVIEANYLDDQLDYGFVEFVLSF